MTSNSINLFVICAHLMLTYLTE